VDLLEKSLLVFLILTIVFFLELSNSSFDSGTLVSHISDEDISRLCDADLCVILRLCKACLDGVAGCNESFLEFSAASLKLILCIGSESSAEIFDFPGGVVNSTEKASLGLWKVTDEVSLEEGLDFVVSLEFLWVLGHAVLVVDWVVCGIMCWVLITVFVVSVSVSVCVIILGLTFVAVVAVVLLQPPDPVLDEVVQEGVESGELKVNTRCKAIGRCLNVSGKGIRFSSAGISKSLKLIVCGGVE
jgi:hypothetical protein